MPPGDDSSQLDELKARLDAIERRLSALEQSSNWLPSLPNPAEAPLPAQRLPPQDAVAAQPNPFSVIGFAVLGIAGAYLLRALAESHALPPSIVVAVALVYASGWLVWAARSQSISRLAGWCYAITSALILAPMLWEVTVRFGILPPPLTALVLAAFASLALFLAWRSHLSSVVWVGMLAAVVTAFGLMVAAREPVAFTSAVLFAALLAEFAGCRGRWPGLRFVMALAADFAVLIMLVILGDSSAVPQEYHPASPALMMALVFALFTVYAAALAFRSLVLQLRIAVLEAVQFPAAALLVVWSVLRITGGTGTRALGIFCLVVAAACYFAAFALRSRHRAARNFILYAVWAPVFLLAGSFFAIPEPALVIWLSLAAVAVTGLGVRLRNPALDLQGVGYLAGAVIASGLLGYAGRALTGTFPPAPGGLTFFSAAVAVLCAALISRYPGEHWAERLLRLFPAVFAVFAIAALGVTVLVWLFARGAAPSLPLLSVIRTVVMCAVALLLALAGARFERMELVWMAYGAAVLGTLKIAFEDFRMGNTQSLAFSLLILGAVLILLPRLARARRQHS